MQGLKENIFNSTDKLVGLKKFMEEQITEGNLEKFESISKDY